MALSFQCGIAPDEELDYVVPAILARWLTLLLRQVVPPSVIDSYIWIYN